MLNIKSMAGAVVVLGGVVLMAACGGTQSGSPATDATGQPDDQPISGGGSDKPHDSSKDSPDTSVGDVRVSSAFDKNGEPIPGADGDISPDAKRPTPPPPDASASASATPATTPPKKGGKPTGK